jgi:phosphatidylserine decarboxylase
MPASQAVTPIKSRAGGWLPHGSAHVGRWTRGLKKYAARQTAALVPPIADLKAMVETNPVLHAQVAAMFAEARHHMRHDPIGRPEVATFGEFLTLLNAIVTTAPEAYEDIPTQQPAGMIGFPINALLDWPMATASGHAVFSNSLFNRQLKKILAYWAEFLTSPASRYVLTERASRLDPETLIVPWLGDWSRGQMVKVAQSAVGAGPNPTPDTFEHIFACDPGADYHGYRSWDDFFTRTFRPGVRPLPPSDDDTIIVNACESAPLRVKTGVPLDARFWLKGQPYSLVNMLDFDELAPQFAGGTVYQAFLNALSYHRWNSPVSGVVRKAYVVNGSYYLENLYEGFANPHGADPAAPNDSQPFIASVATRAIIFIEADNPAIGLICVLAVGMAEVSSCDIAVRPGDGVNRGDQIGMFHFGGSTHCLLFRPGVDLDFEFYGQHPGLNAANMRVNTPLARLRG